MSMYLCAHTYMPCVLVDMLWVCQARRPLSMARSLPTVRSLSLSRSIVHMHSLRLLVLNALSWNIHMYILQRLKASYYSTHAHVPATYSYVPVPANILTSIYPRQPIHSANCCTPDCTKAPKCAPHLRIVCVHMYAYVSA